MPAAPYDTLEAVANTARVRINDAIQSIGGDVFTDTAAFSITAINSAWRRLQEFAVDLGEVRLVQEGIIATLPATTLSDLGGQVWIDWTGYNPGSGLNAGFVLPMDLISPLKLWERVSGSIPGVYQDMSKIEGGLPTVPKSALNKFWEWRYEKVWMPGATGSTDLRIRYAAYLADFVPAVTTGFNLQSVPMMRVLSPFAWYMCSEIAKARGDLDAGYFDQKAMEATVYAFNRNFAQGKAQGSQAESGKMTDKYTPASGIPLRGVK